MQGHLKAYLPTGLLCIFIVIVSAWFISAFGNYLGGADWSILVNTAHDWFVHQRIYTNNTGAYGPSGVYYKFPPFFLTLIITCIQFNLDSFVADQDGWWHATHLQRGFIYLQFIFYFSSVLIIISLFRKRTQPFALYIVIAAVTLLFLPFFENLANLQLEVMIFFLLVLTVYLDLQNRHLAAAICLGIAAGIKLYPVIFIVVLLFRRPLTAIGGLLIGFLFTILVSLTVVSVSDHLYYFTSVVPTIIKEDIATYVDNVSLSAIFVFITGSQYIGKLIGLLLSVLIVALCYHFNEAAKTNRMIVINLYSVVVCLFLLASKNIWPSYQLLLLYPILANIIQGDYKRAPERWVLAVALLAIIPLLIFFRVITKFVITDFHAQRVVYDVFRASLTSFCLVVSLIFLFGANRARCLANKTAPM